MSKALLLALVLLGASAPVMAAPPPPIKYEPNLAFKREIFVKLFLQTRRCMSTGSVAMLRQNVRDRNLILDFTTQSCGQPLFVFLRDDASHTPLQAAMVINNMAERTLDDEINVGK